MPIVTSGNVDSLQMVDPISFNALINSVASGSGSSTSFTTINPLTAGRWQFTGTGLSNYQNGIPQSGTITAVTYFSGGSQSVTITGLSLSVSAFLIYLNNDDQFGFYAAAFAGNDTINGSSFSDGLTGYGGINTINAGAGDDVIALLGSRDTVDGGEGLDTIYLDRSALTSAMTLNLSGMSTAIGAVLSDGSVIRNVEAFRIWTGAGNDTLIFSGPISGGNAYIGGGGIDAIVLDLSGSSVAYQLLGNRIQSSPSDVLDLFDVEQIQVTGGSAGDQFYGGLGADVLSGGDGTDFLDGFNGNDILNGDAGNDTIRGGAGSNVLNGGDGDDDISASTFDSSTTSIDIVDGGAGFDVLTLDRYVNTSAFSFSTSAMASTAGATLSDGTVIRNIEAFRSISLGAGNDNLTIDTGRRRD